MPDGEDDDDAFELTVSVNWFHALGSQNEMSKNEKRTLTRPDAPW